MATTTTNYAYDKSGRMTTMSSTDTADATYFTYNQRDMVTKILRLPAGGDATRTFTYNAVGERVVVDETGGTTPNYWTYDGYKLLTEKSNAGAEVRRYRHNAMQQERLGSNIEMHNPSVANTYPVTNQVGGLDQLVTIEGNDSFERNTFAELQNKSTLTHGDRLLLAQELGAQALTTTLPFFVTPSGGAYFSRIGVAFGGAAGGLTEFGLLMASSFAGLHAAIGVGCDPWFITVRVDPDVPSRNEGDTPGSEYQFGYKVRVYGRGLWACRVSEITRYPFIDYTNPIVALPDGGDRALDVDPEDMLDDVSTEGWNVIDHVPDPEDPRGTLPQVREFPVTALPPISAWGPNPTFKEVGGAVASPRIFRGIHKFVCPQVRLPGRFPRFAPAYVRLSRQSLVVVSDQNGKTRLTKFWQYTWRNWSRVGAAFYLAEFEDIFNIDGLGDLN